MAAKRAPGDSPRQPSKKLVPHIEPRPQQKSRKTKPNARTTAAMKYLRDSRIVSDHLRGVSWERIMEQHGVGYSTAVKICASWRHYTQIVFDEDPITYVERRIAQFDAHYKKLAEIVESAESDSDKIAAITRQMASMEKATDLMQRTGILPNNLGDVRVHVDFKVIGVTFARILEDEGVPLPVQEKLARALIDSGARGRNSD